MGFPTMAKRCSTLGFSLKPANRGYHQKGHTYRHEPICIAKPICSRQRIRPPKMTLFEIAPLLMAKRRSALKRSGNVENSQINDLPSPWPFLPLRPLIRLHWPLPILFFMGCTSRRGWSKSMFWLGGRIWLAKSIHFPALRSKRPQTPSGTKHSKTGLSP